MGGAGFGLQGKKGGGRCQALKRLKITPITVVASRRGHVLCDPVSRRAAPCRGRRWIVRSFDTRRAAPLDCRPRREVTESCHRGARRHPSASQEHVPATRRDARDRYPIMRHDRVRTGLTIGYQDIPYGMSRYRTV